MMGTVPGVLIMEIILLTNQPHQPIPSFDHVFGYAGNVPKKTKKNIFGGSSNQNQLSFLGCTPMLAAITYQLRVFNFAGNHPSFPFGSTVLCDF